MNNRIWQLIDSKKLLEQGLVPLLQCLRNSQQKDFCGEGLLLLLSTRYGQSSFITTL